LLRIVFCQTNDLFILQERAEKEIRFSMANGTFKLKMDIDRHGPRLMPKNCKNLNPPYFSLPSTFNDPSTPCSVHSKSWSNCNNIHNHDQNISPLLKSRFGSGLWIFRKV
jgi:hypothetical protein